MKLNLDNAERAALRRHKIKLSEIITYSIDELSEILHVDMDRTKTIYALADFQRIPSIGIKFAEDLIFLGYYSVLDLQGKDGAELTDLYEKKKGYKTDVCVEDQFRLVVHYANTNDESKRWWDFTEERKKFRAKEGYPKDRPELNWFEIMSND